MALAMVGEALISASVEILLDRITSAEFRDFFANRKLNVSLLDELKVKLLALNAVLNDAEEKQLTNSAVKAWIDELKDAVLDAEDLLDEINTDSLRCKVEGEFKTFTTQVRSLFSSPFNQFYRSMNSKLEAISRRLENFRKQIESLGLKIVAGRVSCRKETDRSVEYVVAREDEKNKLLSMLLSDEDENNSNIQVLTIWGMGGLGKTTLAQSLLNDDALQNHFDLKAWAYLKLNQQVNEILEILTPCVSHSLTRLIISRSQLSGYLTDQIGLFKNIVIMNFVGNSIHGALPRSFGKLSSLHFLDLSQNKFNGNPFQVLRSLYELSYLSIEDNLFQGVVKEDDLVNLTKLNSLLASGNNLTLKVGPNWHPSFQLKELEMNSWQLGPNFPSWIQSQKVVQSLEISNTGISDSIAWFWEKFYDAWTLNLSHNHIHGELPNTLVSRGDVDLSSNQIHGKLPYLNNYIGWLDLSSNSLSRSMTDFLCKKHKSSLTFLNLASNNLSGKIPDCWMTWPNLVDVNLQSNHFVGNLPPSMGSLTELQTLYLRNNSLSGMFPTFLEKTNELICLDVGENKFTGTIPAWIGKSLSKLIILRLRSNRFFGHIPKELCDMIFLQDLDLAINNLSGQIPNCFNNLSAMLLRNRSAESVIYADAYSHKRGSSIVNSLMWVKGSGVEYRNILGLVTNVDLSSNNLSGGIPREITYLDGLIFLNLSKNQLSDQIPPSIGNMRSVESIDFSQNQLSGPIPPTISNLSFLSQLDVSYNHLEGEIPTGTQIQTFEASDFVGNNLCGRPLPINCSSQNPNDDPNEKEGDGHGVNWYFVSMAVGFIVGFWAVVAPLFIFRSWRYAYYRFLDDMWYKIRYCW